MASSSISIESNLNQYKNPANWENQDKKPFDVIKIPFRPSAKSKVLTDAHYFPSPQGGTRPSIYTVAPVPSPLHADPPKQPSLTLNYLKEWHSVCGQSIELVKDNELILAQWQNPIESKRIDHLRAACDAIKSYYDDNDMNSDKLKASIDFEEIHMPEVFRILKKSLLNNPSTSPEVLYALYQARKMSRPIISKHILKNPQKSPTKGRSASSWKFENLVDLCCIPLFNVGMEGIIPGKKIDDKNPTGFHEMSKTVGRLINNCYIVKRILNEVTMATETELSRFTTTHMSWFLLNPWCLFFTTLRDLLTRQKAEVGGPRVGVSLISESLMADEDKLEASSEQLLHRFMEVILVLFSILCGERDVYRSTPGRVKKITTIGSKSCKIEDDGYVYVCRGGTSGHHVTTNRKSEKEVHTTHLVCGKMAHEPSDRNRYGEIPIIRYEAKRFDLSPTVNSQIFSELLSAAISNMEYLEISDPKASILPEDLRDEMVKETEGTKKPSVPYHDAFVIHIHHYTLTIHTARFPTDYLKWVTDATKDDSPAEKYCILHKVSDPYDLSNPKARLSAARDILTLLWAIKKSKPTKDGSSLFVARAVMRQSIGYPKQTDERPDLNAHINEVFKDPGKFLIDRKVQDGNNGRNNQANNAQSASQSSNKQGYIQQTSKPVVTQTGNAQSASQSFNKIDGKKRVSNSIRHPAAGQRAFLTKDVKATNLSDNFLNQNGHQGQAHNKEKAFNDPPSVFTNMLSKGTASTGGQMPKQEVEKISIETEAEERPSETHGAISGNMNNPFRQYATSEVSNLNPFYVNDTLIQQPNETRNTRTNRENSSGMPDISPEGKVTDTTKRVMIDKNPFEDEDHTYNQSKSRRKENVSNNHEKKILEKQMNKEGSYGDEKRGDERGGNRREGYDRGGDGREDYERSGNNRRGGDRGGGYDRGGDYYRKRDHRSGEDRRSEERGGGNRNDGRASYSRRDGSREKDRRGEGSRNYQRDDRERKGYKNSNRSGRRSYSSSYER